MSLHVIGLTVSDDNQVEFRLELRRPESNLDLFTGKLTGSGLFDNGVNLAVIESMLALCELLCEFFHVVRGLGRLYVKSRSARLLGLLLWLLLSVS